MENNQVRVGVGVFIVKNEEILIGWRLSKLGLGTWALPGGHLEFGETPYDCAKREVLEETGLIINEIKIGPWTNDFFHELDRQYITLFLIAKYDGGNPVVLEPDKCSEWKWLKLSEIPRPLFKALDNLLENGFNTEKLLSFFK
jgi:8-oxo-dGTP diphosphatase